MTIDSAVFYTADIDKVVAFYEGVLGFTVEYRRDDSFVSFILDNGVRLGIKRAVEEREVPGAQTVFIGVENVEGLHEKYQSLGVEFYKPLSYLKGFGKNFSLYDPDRNKVQFVERELA